jgi:predicted phosphodiesterase
MQQIKFAVFTDLHHDHIHDGGQRLENLICLVSQEEVDFIIQLGDFCSPKEDNRWLLDMLESIGKPCYHVIGNHDSDVSSKEEAMTFLGMDNSYYSFRYGQVKFVVLDACFIQNEYGYEPYSKKNYGSTEGLYPVIPQEQLNWLENQLSEDCPYFVVLSHHSLENGFKKRGVYNRNEVQELINNANASGKKVLLCINGHDHADSIEKLGQTYYFGLNSMSYIWFGPEHRHFCYSDEIHRQYPLLKDIVMYQDGAYAVITIKENGDFEIQGMERGYHTVSPRELGIEGTWNGRNITPNISSLKILNYAP